jgi:hypothetical protein
MAQDMMVQLRVAVAALDDDAWMFVAPPAPSVASSASAYFK